MILYIYTQKYIIHLYTLQTQSQLDENPMILEKLPSNQNWCRYHSISEPNLAPTRFKSPSSIYLKMLLLEKQGRVGQGNPRPPTISSRLCNAMVHWDVFSPRSFLASFNWKWTREVRRYVFGKRFQGILHNWMERIKAWWVVPALRRLPFDQSG